MSLSEFFQEQLNEKIKLRKKEREHCKKSVHLFESIIRDIISKKTDLTYHIPIINGCGPEIKELLKTHQLYPWIATDIYAVKRLVVSFDIEKNKYHLTLF